MTPGEREFGELLAEVKGLGKQISDMEQRNSSEHASVIGAIGELRADLGKKVDWSWVREQKLPERLGSLEESRSESKGRDSVVKGAIGAVIALLGIFVSNGGHI